MAGEFEGAMSGAAAGTAIMPGWGTAIGAGVGLLSGFMGSNRAKREAARRAAAIEEQNRFMREVYADSEARAQPFRDELYPQLLSILGGEEDVSSLPMYAGRRGALEGQFQRAREATQGRAPGGIKESLMAELEGTRASSIGDLHGQLYSQLLTPGLAIAAGRPELGLAAGQAGMQGLLPLLEGANQQVGYNQQLIAGGGQALGQSLYEQFLKGKPTPRASGGGPMRFPSQPYDYSQPFALS